ncbi:MAG: aspartate ammonia-lyase [Defluviitaleaceae bacterium]|nr:aspartate ammonia-lyase [Defluviitaleaceae bacterium]
MPTNGYRTESDFIGSREVPENAYYGIQTLRALENFPVTGYKLHKSRIVSIAMVKKAAAMANVEAGLMDEEIGNYITSAAQDIIDGKYHDEFLVDPIQGGAGTSINMNANEVITNVALEKMGHPKGTYSIIHPNNDVNMSQSTNDAVPASVFIATRMVLNDLLATMEDLHESFKSKSIEFDSVIKMGRTHLQDAVPIRLGQEFDGYARVLKRDMGRIGRTRKSLCIVNMGATAVGTGLNADPKYIKYVVKYLSEITGLPICSPGSLVDATQNSDTYVEVFSALKICMINMSKIASDLRLMASGPYNGFNEIKLPARQPGSSIMPGKVNPVMPELINQVAFQVMGSDVTISMAAEAGQLELNVMGPVIVFNLIQSITMMDNAFKAFDKFCVRGITANEELLRKNVANSVALITAMKPHIGYEASSKIAKEAMETGKSVREICLRDNYLTAEELDLILDPQEMTNIGIAGSKLLNKKRSHTHGSS